MPCEMFWDPSSSDREMFGNPYRFHSEVFRDSMVKFGGLVLVPYEDVRNPP